jgi:hypothetical protein
VNAIFEVGQRGSRARLEQRAHKTILGPNGPMQHDGRNARNSRLRYGGFRQPLLIGRLAIQCAGRQDFTVLNRQRPEFHRVVIRVDPLIDVSRTIANFDHLKFVVTGLSVLDLIVTLTFPRYGFKR